LLDTSGAAAPSKLLAATFLPTPNYNQQALFYQYEFVVLPYIQLDNGLSSQLCSPPAMTDNFFTEEAAISSTLEREQFVANVLEFGIPSVICFLISAYITVRMSVDYRLAGNFLYSFFTSRPNQFERWYGFSFILLFSIIFAPMFLFIAWGVTAYIYINPLLGITIGFLSLSTVFAISAMQKWKGNNWRLTRRTQLYFWISLGLLLIFEFWMMLLAKPHTVMSISAVMLALNLIPMAHLTILITKSFIKPFDSYADITQLISKSTAQAGFTSRLASSSPKPFLSPRNDQNFVNSSPTLLKKVILNNANSVRSINNIMDRAKDNNGSNSPHSINANIVHNFPLSPDHHIVRIGSHLAQSISSSAEPTEAMQGSASPPDLLSPTSSTASAVAGPTPNSSDSFHHKVKLFCVYMVAIMVKAVYSLLVYFLVENPSDVYIGFVTMAATVALDISVFLCIYGGKISSPSVCLLFVTGGRIGVLIFGADLYFCGHSLMFFLLSFFYGQVIINNRLPRCNSAENDVNLIKSISKLAQNHKKRRQSKTRSLRELASAVKQFSYIEYFLRNIDIFTVLFLTGAFLLDLACCYLFSRVNIVFQRSYPQYLVGCYSLLLSIIIFCTKLLFRLYENSNYKASWAVCWLAAALYLFIVFAGAAFYSITMAPMVLALFSLSPLIVYLGCVIFAAWRANDFHWIGSALYRNPPKLPLSLRAVLAGALPKQDYIMFLAILLELFLIAAMGFCVSYFDTPAWLGWTISGGIFILVTTIVPIIQWFKTFEASPAFFGSISLSLCSHLGLCFSLWHFILDRSMANTSYLVLFLCIFYPAVVLIAVAFYKWSDDNWRLSSFVKGVLAFASLMLITIFTLVAFFFKPYEIGATGLLGFVIIILFQVVAPQLSRFSRTFSRLFSGALVLVIFLFALSVGLQSQRGFLGATLGIGILAVLLGVWAYNLHMDTGNVEGKQGGVYIYYSPRVFPVFKYRAQAGLTDPISEGNMRVYVVYGLLALIYCWSAAAIYFVGPPIIGICISSLTIVTAIIYTIGLLRKSGALFAEAVQFLEEGSSVYLDVVHKARVTAMAAQLILKKTVFDSAAAATDGSLNTNPNSVKDLMQRKASPFFTRRKSKASVAAATNIASNYITPTPSARKNSQKDNNVPDFHCPANSNRRRNSLGLTVQLPAKDGIANNSTNNTLGNRVGTPSVQHNVHSDSSTPPPHDGIFEHKLDEAVLQSNILGINAHTMNPLLGTHYNNLFNPNLTSTDQLLLEELDDGTKNDHKALELQAQSLWDAIPKFKLLSCCYSSQRSSTKVKPLSASKYKETDLEAQTAVDSSDCPVLWQNYRLSRGEAYQLVHKLVSQASQVYMAYSKFKVQFELEIVAVSRRLISENERMLFKMLHRTGRADLSLDYIRRLGINSPERKQLEEDLQKYQADLKLLRQQNKQKRVEELAALKRREETVALNQRNKELKRLKDSEAAFARKKREMEQLEGAVALATEELQFGQKSLAEQIEIMTRRTAADEVERVKETERMKALENEVKAEEKSEQDEKLRHGTRVAKRAMQIMELDRKITNIQHQLARRNKRFSRSNSKLQSPSHSHNHQATELEPSKSHTKLAAILGITVAAAQQFSHNPRVSKNSRNSGFNSGMGSKYANTAAGIMVAAIYDNNETSKTVSMMGNFDSDLLYSDANSSSDEEKEAAQDNNNNNNNNNNTNNNINNNNNSATHTSPQNTNKEMNGAIPSAVLPSLALPPRPSQTRRGYHVRSSSKFGHALQVNTNLTPTLAGAAVPMLSSATKPAVSFASPSSRLSQNVLEEPMDFIAAEVELAQLQAEKLRLLRAHEQEDAEEEIRASAAANERQQRQEQISFERENLLAEWAVRDEARLDREELIEMLRSRVAELEIALKEAEQNQQLEKDYARKLLSSCKADCLCTFVKTGNKLTYQKWFSCLTCQLFAESGHGVCAQCANICHLGHKLLAQNPGMFYCDCSTNKKAASNFQCKTLKSKSQIEAELLQQASYPQWRRAPHKRQKQLSPLLDISSQFNQIVEQCRARNDKWIDPEFPPSDVALFIDPHKPVKSWAKFVWKRASELVENPQMFVEPLNPSDIKQGVLGDCWLMSALAVLTLRPCLLKECFVTAEYSDVGVYAVKFHKNGQIITVLIDDFFPCYVRKAADRVQLAFGQSMQPTELWVMIIEKAYAKLHHSYQAIESGTVDAGLVDLTGGISDRIDLTSSEAQTAIRNGSLWRQVLSYFEAGFLMGAGSPAGSDAEINSSSFGIVQGHAYSILQLASVDNISLIQLRNPWGRKEWNGDWSDDSKLWTRRMIAKLNFVKSNDGAFWMSWQDFVVHFEDIYICRFFDKKQWVWQKSLEGEWKGVTAGGCTNCYSVQNSPQYELKLLHHNTDVVITLAQLDSRGTKDGEIFAIGIEVYENEGQRISRRKRGKQVAANPSGYIFRREVTCQFNLPVLDKAQSYTVLISTFHPARERQFTLNLYATKEIQFQALAMLPATQ
jgi:hypothetical protein